MIAFIFICLLLVATSLHLIRESKIQEDFIFTGLFAVPLFLVSASCLICVTAFYLWDLM